MLTNEIRNQIDQIWNAFWSGGISNPLEVIEQIIVLKARSSEAMHLTNENTLVVLWLGWQVFWFTDIVGSNYSPGTDDGKCKKRSLGPDPAVAG